MPTLKTDVFISHVSSDENYASKLTKALEKSGLDVWLTSREITLGDSIFDTINRGLENTRYGILIISPDYLQQADTMNQLKALLARSSSEGKKSFYPFGIISL